MLVLATYTIYQNVEVPDDASDTDITEACAAEAPRGDYDEFSWENY